MFIMVVQELLETQVALRQSQTKMCSHAVELTSKSTQSKYGYYKNLNISLKKRR